MGERFDYFEVTADVGVNAYGDTLNEVFENSALAMFGVMCNTSKVECKIEKKVSVNADDLEGLLREWLTALLAMKDIHAMMFGKFRVNVNEKGLTLTATACGEETKEKHEVSTEVKAVTSHMLEVRKNKRWNARFILDI